MNALDSTSTRPYLIRALYEWCTDNGFTPYVAVFVDDTVRVPMEYVKNGEIVLNISYDATSSLKLGNDFIEFKARFAGTPRDIMVPISRVIAVYARENGQGMAFPGPFKTDINMPGHPPALVSVPDGVDAMPVDSKVVSMLSTGSDKTMHREADTSVPDHEPDPPLPPAGKRPSLKRVK